MGQRQNQAVASLNLAVSNNVPVRWMEAVAMPSVAPKAVNPAHPRRKNV
jgi:hypothetical protein